MSEQIEKFDPAKLMDGVRDRIKATFVSLIPDDQWERLVKKEIDDFFMERVNQSSYHNHNYSYFGEMVRKELVLLTTEKVRKLVIEKYVSSGWDNDGPILSEALQEELEKAAPKMLKTIFAQLLRDTMNQMGVR